MLQVKHNKYLWTHLSEPSREDILKMNQKYNFHELLLEDLLELNSENKVELYEGESVVITVNFPKYNQKVQKYLLNSFVIVIGKDYIISVSRFHSSNVQRLVAKLKNSEMVKQDLETTFDVAYEIIDVMYDKTIRGLSKASKEVLKLQETIMYSKKLQRKYLEELMTKKVNMVILQHTFRPQREVLHEMKRDVIKLYKSNKDDTEEVVLYVDDLDSKLDKIINNISVLFETVRSLTDTYNSLMNIKTNNIITLLTIFTAVTGIMAVIVWAYGMNVPLPFSDSPHTFGAIVVLMISLVLIIGIWFRKKGRI